MTDKKTENTANENEDPNDTVVPPEPVDYESMLEFDFPRWEEYLVKSTDKDKDKKDAVRAELDKYISALQEFGKTISVKPTSFDALFENFEKISFYNDKLDEVNAFAEKNSMPKKYLIKGFVLKTILPAMFVFLAQASSRKWKESIPVESYLTSDDFKNDIQAVLGKNDVCVRCSEDRNVKVNYVTDYLGKLVCPICSMRPSKYVMDDQQIAKINTSDFSSRMRNVVNAESNILLSVRAWKLMAIAVLTKEMSKHPVALSINKSFNIAKAIMGIKGVSDEDQVSREYFSSLLASNDATAALAKMCNYRIDKWCDPQGVGEVVYLAQINNRPMLRVVQRSFEADSMNVLMDMLALKKTGVFVDCLELIRGEFDVKDALDEIKRDFRLSISSDQFLQVVRRCYSTNA